MLTWELTGAVVGAGMASGREIASFFARYGRWGIAGIGFSIGTMIFLADVRMPVAWRERWIGKSWQLLQNLLLIFTGGAMLSGGGEIAALTLRVKRADWIGIVGTMLLAWMLGRHTECGLAWLSRILLAVLLLMMCMGLLFPGKRVIIVEGHPPVEALLRGATYGGFNAALQAPIMLQHEILQTKARRRAVSQAGLLVGAVLMLGHAVLLRHPALINETLPMIALLTRMGKGGYYLGAVCLYLAILSTLTACLRGVHCTALPMMGMVMISTLGLTGVVDVAYPLLGGGCFLLMFMAKLRNYRFPSFHSKADML